jgi:hypothetical protein
MFLFIEIKVHLKVAITLGRKKIFIGKRARLRQTRRLIDVLLISALRIT